MNLEILKRFNKDWTIEDNKIKLIGEYKKQFESGKKDPHKIAGHRLYNFLSLNRFFPAAMAQMEMFGLIKKINNPDSEINMLSGQKAESEIVKYLNKQYGSSNGTTYPYTAENKGNVFETTISNIFSALPDYITEAKHTVFADKKRKHKMIHEIKSTLNNKWARDEYQNFILDVVDDSITEDNIIDNPNKDAIAKIYAGLTKKELESLDKTEKKEIEEYIKSKGSKVPSKAFYVSLIKRYGIKKWMIEGDIEHNLQPIIKNAKSIKVKPRIAIKNYAINKWKQEGQWFAPEEYIYQVSLYSFLYNMDKNKIQDPKNVKGKYKTKIDVVFLDDNQMVIPENSWFNKFTYIYNPPKPIKIDPKHNFATIDVEIDLHKFYKNIIKPCMEIWDNTISKQETQELDYVSWAILKKALRENGYDVDQFKNIMPSLETQKVSLIKSTVDDYNTKLKAEKKDKAEKQKLVDLFYSQNSDKNKKEENKKM